MKNIIFIAPPAAGKGTQSEVLVEKYNYIHISIGDLLRIEIEKETKIGKEAKILMDQGLLAPDELVMKLLKNILEKTDGPFVLDGYPRNINQAQMLDELMTNLNKKLHLALFFDISIEEAIKRVVGRQNCTNCNKLYNLYEPTLKPKVANECDDCGNQLASRSDDTEETCRTRFQTFMENTLPLIKYYEQKGNLVNIKVKDTVMGTFSEIEKVIKNS